MHDRIHASVHIVHLSSTYEQFKDKNLKNVTKILIDHQPLHLGEWKTIFQFG